MKTSTEVFDDNVRTGKIKIAKIPVNINGEIQHISCINVIMAIGEAIREVKSED